MLWAADDPAFDRCWLRLRDDAAITRGLDGLYDRSKAPYRQANKLPFQVERTILGIKKEHPSWGAPRIRDKLIREYPMIPPPAVSTMHAALDSRLEELLTGKDAERGRAALADLTPEGIRLNPDPTGAT